MHIIIFSLKFTSTLGAYVPILYGTFVSKGIRNCLVVSLKGECLGLIKEVGYDYYKLGH